MGERLCASFFRFDLQGSSDKPGSAAKGKGKGKDDRAKSAKGGKGGKGAAKTPEPPSGKNPSKLKKRGEIDESEIYIGQSGTLIRFISVTVQAFEVLLLFMSRR